MKTCCFIGHRNVEETPELRKILIDTIGRLITEKDVSRFLFGSKSRFDDFCQKIVAEIRIQYPHIQRVYVRMYYPELSELYTNYLLENFEKTYMPEGIEKAGVARYVERNQAMIDASDFCIFYYNENYQPPVRKQSRRALSAYQPKSGTKLAYQYAIQKNKEIINVYQK